MKTFKEINIKVGDQVKITDNRYARSDSGIKPNNNDIGFITNIVLDNDVFGIHLMVEVRLQKDINLLNDRTYLIESCGIKVINHDSKKVYCRGVSNRGEEVIKALEELGGINTMGYTGYSEGLYYIIGKNSAISTLIVAPLTTWLLEQTFTEIFPSGKPRETIIVGGIEYDKQEVENRLKDLQPLK